MEILNGICSSCKNETKYYEGRNWFGRNEILCNSCVSFKHKEIQDKVAKIANQRNDANPFVE